MSDTTDAPDVDADATTATAKPPVKRRTTTADPDGPPVVAVPADVASTGARFAVVRGLGCSVTVADGNTLTRHVVPAGAFIPDGVAPEELNQLTALGFIRPV